MNVLEKVIIFATEKHAGQVDKLGHPYILHPLRLMQCFNPEEQDAQIVALLHDVLEDTDATIDDLVQLGISPIAISAISTLTRNSGESYRDYIRRVAPFALARRVKVCDLEDNATWRLYQLYQLDPTDAKRLKEKYDWAYEYLTGKFFDPLLLMEK